MQPILDRILRRFVVLGVLEVTWPDSSVTRYEGRDAGVAAASVHLVSAGSVRRLVLEPNLAMGELYMEGGLVPLACSIHDFLDLVGVNVRADRLSWPGMTLHLLVGRMLRRFHQYNPVQRARRNVAHHYDLSGELYGLFLDADRQYSCAYFATGTETLEQAQAAKKAHIAAKLLLAPGMSVLDIGCGWGGMALTLARDFGVRVTGITLSSEQLAVAQERAEAEGLSGLATFRLQDYRDVRETFDRIVSVGMFEHVGLAHYPDFFASVRRCLAPQGVALLHTIGLTDGPHATNKWMAKYIFPGGYSPALSEVMPAVETSGLVATDIEVLRLHYALTIAQWRARFAANRQRIAGLYDERFCRMFEFYLALSEMAFRRLTHVNFQIQLSRAPFAAPITRDYMAAPGSPGRTGEDRRNVGAVAAAVGRVAGGAAL